MWDGYMITIITTCDLVGFSYVAFGDGVTPPPYQHPQREKVNRGSSPLLRNQRLQVGRSLKFERVGGVGVAVRKPPEDAPVGT